MIFRETAIRGAWIVDVEPVADDRGLFARTFCAREFEAHGLCVNWVQCSVSFNQRKNTLRGMHYQSAPAEETKLVRCTKGALFDVIVDLRRDSSTFRQWVGVELTEQSRRTIYVPAGCAHGFQTLQDDTEVFYQISAFYEPSLARGVRWDDPAFNIAWPKADLRVMSDRDRSYADFRQ